MAVVWRLPKVPLLDRRMPQPHPPAMSAELRAVGKAAKNRDVTDQLYAQTLLAARRAGHTFEEIAKAAGTTRSAIHNYLSRRGQT